jgi:hypothetical protein
MQGIWATMDASLLCYSQLLEWAWKSDGKVKPAPAIDEDIQDFGEFPRLC